MASVHTLGRLVELKFRIGFVNGVVSQVHEEIGKVLLLGDAVGYIGDKNTFSRESRQALFVNIDPKRVTACN